jgi:RNA polymerase sigma factor (sigma-70 family)
MRGAEEAGARLEDPLGREWDPHGDAERLMDLVRGAAAGDRGAWSALVERFAPLVWSVVRGYRLSPQDAADVSQTTWLRLAEHLHRLRQPERIAGWLATTAGRECLALIRRNRRQLPTTDEMLTEVPDPDVAGLPETSLLASVEQAELWEAFSTLPQRFQILLRLLFADPQPSYQQIAAATGMSVGSIGPTRGRALQLLRDCIRARATGAVDS